MMSFYKNWWVHDCIAHPLMQFLKYISPPLADKLHDTTYPESKKNRGKGEMI